MNALMNENLEFSYAGLFRTKSEWIHPRRTEKTHEIIFVTKGEVYLREGEQEYALKQGQALILSPHVPHYGTRQTKDVGFYWVHFSLKGAELPFQKRFFEAFEYMYLFKELLHYNNLPCVPEYAVNSLLAHILSAFCYLSEKSAIDYNSTAEAVYEWIRINASAALTVKSVAEHFGYSSDHISRICKKYYSIGAGELIDRFLLARAKELLCNTEKYVKEIAADLAFSSDKAFIAYFKYHVGSYPLGFRNLFGKIHMNSR